MCHFVSYFISLNFFLFMSSPLYLFSSIPWLDYNDVCHKKIKYNNNNVFIMNIVAVRSVLLHSPVLCEKRM